MKNARRFAANLILPALLLGSPVARAGGRAFMLALSYDENAVLEVHADGSVGDAILNGSDGLGGPFGASAIVRGPDDCLYIGNFDSLELLRICGSPPQVTVLADGADGLNTPDGLAPGTDGEIYVANRFSRNILRVDPNGDVYEVDALDGRPMCIVAAPGWLFVADDLGNIFGYDAQTPSERVLIANISDGLAVGNVALAVSADGGTLYHLDAGVLRAIPALGGPAEILASGMGGADEGLAVLERAGGRLPPLFFAADFAGVIYRFAPGGVPSVFSTGVPGVSGMLLSSCGELLTCDSNCDGSIDVLDINPFVTAIIDPGLYLEQFPACDWLCNNDINFDGAVNVLDISGFVDCVLGE
ncbi:hypothetical protein RAS1_39160 [Phycisphaerae bacterium RAS1]|nr:hypothetical protein RAS1_39160 [Phycisphaerae bacterium RAS1]